MRLTTAAARCEVSLEGGHVLSYVTSDSEDLLFVSRSTQHPPTRPIRGGVPVCWPWFAGEGSPSHGFARIRRWRFRACRALPDAVELTLSLPCDDETRARWPHEFGLDLVVRLGADLQVELQMLNLGAEPWSWTGALHTYLHVGDVRQARVEGLSGVTYFDKVDGDAQKVREGAVRFPGEVDEAYVDTAGACVVHDPVLERRIQVTKHHSASTVVWNPGETRARAMADLDDDRWHRFVCVEAGNVLANRVTVEPGASSTMSTRLALLKP